MSCFYLRLAVSGSRGPWKGSWNPTAPDERLGLRDLGVLVFRASGFKGCGFNWAHMWTDLDKRITETLKS